MHLFVIINIATVVDDSKTSQESKKKMGTYTRPQPRSAAALVAAVAAFVYGGQPASAQAVFASCEHARAEGDFFMIRMLFA